MTEPEHEAKENPQDFLDELEPTIYDYVEKGGKHDDLETRDGS